MIVDRRDSVIVRMSVPRRSRAFRRDRESAITFGLDFDVPAVVTTKGKVTGYAPCLFRAPFGDVSPALIADAHSQGMMTIGWNVDPRDWGLPGVRAIVKRVLTQTRPGSIVLMHDGGGPRDETVAALPRLIAALLARGLRLVTVPELFGLRRDAAVSRRARLSADSPTAA